MSDPASIIAARLAELWRRSLPIMRERMAALHTSIERLSQNPQDEEARASGREAAHKLSGVLTTFGLPHGTELASQIEARLRSGDPLTLEDVATLTAQIAELDQVIASKGDG